MSDADLKAYYDKTYGGERMEVTRDPQKKQNRGGRTAVLRDNRLSHCTRNLPQPGGGASIAPDRFRRAFYLRAKQSMAACRP